MGSSPWGCEELDTTESLSLLFHPSSETRHILRCWFSFYFVLLMSRVQSLNKTFIYFLISLQDLLKGGKERACCPISSSNTPIM